MLASLANETQRGDVSLKQLHFETFKTCKYLFSHCIPKKQMRQYALLLPTCCGTIVDIWKYLFSCTRVHLGIGDSHCLSLMCYQNIRTQPLVHPFHHLCGCVPARVQWCCSLTCLQLGMLSLADPACFETKVCVRAVLPIWD